MRRRNFKKGLKDLFKYTVQSTLQVRIDGTKDYKGTGNFLQILPHQLRLYG